jgi:hypothetical protein
VAVLPAHDRAVAVALVPGVAPEAVLPVHDRAQAVALEKAVEVPV